MEFSYEIRYPRHTMIGQCTTEYMTYLAHFDYRDTGVCAVRVVHVIVDVFISANFITIHFTDAV